MAKIRALPVQVAKTSSRSTARPSTVVSSSSALLANLPHLWRAVRWTFSHPVSLHLTVLRRLCVPSVPCGCPAPPPLAT